MFSGTLLPGLPRTCCIFTLSLSLWFESESESELTIWLAVCWNQFVMATNPLRLTVNNFIFQLNTCGYNPYATSSLTRGWICRSQLLLVLASAVFHRSESRGIHDNILLSQIRDPPPQPGGSGSRIYIPQEQGGPIILTDTGLPFRLHLRLSGLCGQYSPLIWFCSVLLIYSRGEPIENTSIV
jgi:hypothetical protein